MEASDMVFLAVGDMSLSFACKLTLAYTLTCTYFGLNFGVEQGKEIWNISELNDCWFWQSLSFNEVSVVGNATYSKIVSFYDRTNLARKVPPNILHSVILKQQISTCQNINIPDSSFAQNLCFFSTSLHRQFEEIFLFGISSSYQDLHIFRFLLLASIFLIFHFHFPNALL